MSLRRRHNAHLQSLEVHIAQAQLFPPFGEGREFDETQPVLGAKLRRMLKRQLFPGMLSLILQSRISKAKSDVFLAFDWSYNAFERYRPACGGQALIRWVLPAHAWPSSQGAGGLRSVRGANFHSWQVASHAAISVGAVSAPRGPGSGARASAGPPPAGGRRLSGHTTTMDAPSSSALHKRSQRLAEPLEAAHTRLSEINAELEAIAAERPKAG